MASRTLGYRADNTGKQKSEGLWSDGVKLEGGQRKHCLDNLPMENWSHKLSKHKAAGWLPHVQYYKNLTKKL